MPVLITDECISCGSCEAECPNTAIYPAGEPYVIGGQKFAPLNEDHTYVVPAKCTECVGFADEPQCIPSCPTEAIILDTANPETHEQLQAKKDHLDAVGR